MFQSPGGGGGSQAGAATLPAAVDVRYDVLCTGIGSKAQLYSRRSEASDRGAGGDERDRTFGSCARMSKCRCEQRESVCRDRRHPPSGIHALAQSGMARCPIS